ncbi:MAG: metal ABC transporter permease [Syntrophotaleaceae bacterium]
MDGFYGLLAASFAACLVLAGIHCYLGLHVVLRGVIFVDLALAQIAALGGAVALLSGHEPGSVAAFGYSLAFTFVGAAVFALGRFRDERIPQEAVIGITYAVASAVAVLILDRSVHGQEEIKAMLLGSILFVGWAEVGKTFALYLAVGAVHFFLRKPFLEISTDVNAARASGRIIWFWDLVFYATFGLVVTSSVAIAGVLLVFTLLVVPAACAMLFLDRIMPRLLAGWSLGFLGCSAGLFLSVRGDLPTGPAIVAVFGLLLAIGAAGRYLGCKLSLFTRKNPGERQ